MLRKLLASGQLDPEAETVIINSGDGLKTLDAVAPAVTVPPSSQRLKRSRQPALPRAWTSTSVSVRVRIPTILRSYTGGAAEVTAGHGTLREVISDLDSSYPGIGDRILDDGGRIRRFVNVYVDEEDVRFAASTRLCLPGLR